MEQGDASVFHIPRHVDYLEDGNEDIDHLEDDNEDGQEDEDLAGLENVLRQKTEWKVSLDESGRLEDSRGVLERVCHEGLHVLLSPIHARDVSSCHPSCSGIIPEFVFQEGEPGHFG